MGHASMDKMHSPSPLPLPLVLLTPDFTNPHLINKHQKITAARALSRVDSFDAFQKDMLPQGLHEKLDKEVVFCNCSENVDKYLTADHQKEKAEKEVEDDGDIIDEHCDDDMINFRAVGESVRRILGFGYELINSKLGDLKSSVGRRTVWSAGAAALFFATVMYVRKRDRRERQLLMLLLEEKDQVIDLFAIQHWFNWFIRQWIYFGNCYPFFVISYEVFTYSSEIKE